MFFLPLFIFFSLGGHNEFKILKVEKTIQQETVCIGTSVLKMVEIITKVKKKLIYEKIQGFREEEIPM